MSEMCPQCGAMLQMLITDNGVKDNGVKPIRWCLACGYTSEQAAVIRAAVASNNAGAFLHIRAMGRGSTFNELEWKRWELFESLVATAEQDSVLLKEAYQEARANPGQWIVTASIVNRKQLLRGLLGLSWEPCEPPMAIRCYPDGASLDLAMNAHKVMPVSQTRPRWRDLVCRPWKLHWVDRV